MTQHRSTQMHKKNHGGLQERYWQQHNYSRGFQHPTVKDGQIFQTKYQQRYCGIEQCPRWNGLNWYIQTLSSQISKIHILFKCTWNIFKDRPHDQNKPQQVQENWNHIKHFLRPQGTGSRNQPQGKNSKILILVDID